MKSNYLDKEKLKKLYGEIDIPLTYKQICDISGFTYSRGEAKTIFLNRLSRWCLYEKTSSPTRYIIKEFYDEPLDFPPTIISLPTDEAKYKEAEEFFIRRKLTHPEPLPYPMRNRRLISYVCDFHPGITQTTPWKQLRDSIGCPLCKYPFSRFEIMILLGIEGAESRVKFDGVEFDIYIPERNTVIEVDGILYHGDDTPEQIKRKEVAAENNDLNFLKVEEVLDPEKIGVEGSVLYVTPYSVATKPQKEKINKALSKFLPFIYQDNLWDKAADRMRELKQEFYDQKPLKITNGTIIHQHSKDGQLIHTYTASELLDIISSGSAFGYTWEVE